MPPLSACSSSLPEAREEQGFRAERASEGRPGRGGQPAVRQHLGAVLRHYGFAVRPAGDETKAVRLYTEHGASIDAGLVDVQMAAPDGRQTLALLQRGMR
jgi:hypothetical protein